MKTQHIVIAAIVIIALIFIVKSAMGQSAQVPNEFYLKPCGGANVIPSMIPHYYIKNGRYYLNDTEITKYQYYQAYKASKQPCSELLE